MSPPAGLMEKPLCEGSNQLESVIQGDNKVKVKLVVEMFSVIIKSKRITERQNNSDVADLAVKNDSLLHVLRHRDVDFECYKRIITIYITSTTSLT